MINVDTLYRLLNETTQKEWSGGWVDGDEYNRLINYGQEILYKFYFANANENSARTALQAFQKQITLAPPITAGAYLKPVDYKDKLDVQYVYGEGSECHAEGATVGIDFPARNELAMILSSPVRKPSEKKGVIVGELLGSTINIWPQNTNRIILRYYKLLTQAKWAYTVDVGTQEQLYDSANSVNLMWDEGNITDFLDILLLLKGLMLRDTPLIQWVQQSNLITRQVTDEVRGANR